MKPMLTPKEVAERLKVSEKTVDRLAKKGDLRFKKIGGQRRMTEDDLLLQIDKMQEPKEPVKRTRTRRQTTKYEAKPISYTNGRPNYV